MIFPDINEFINSKVINRNTSLFSDDITNNQTKLKNEIFGKSALIIGGAGTIGTSFIKAMLKYEPKTLVVVDINENGLTELTRTLRSDNYIKVPEFYLTYPMSFGSDIFYKMLDKYDSFDIVANFAAHKHVRSEKDNVSIESMIKNNILDAKRLLEYLIIKKPNHFFCVSTDKATNPVNVMGASKKIMENLILSYSNDIKITTARFANVAFSNGSLLDGYLNRLMQRQPISCPKDVKRYFVSPLESGQICLLSCILGNTGDIFFPKLKIEQMVSFKSITESFFKYINIEIDYSKSEEDAKNRAEIMKGQGQCINPYPVYFFETDTSGEKLFEEFYEKKANVNLNRYKSLGVIVLESISKKTVHSHISLIEALFKNKNFNKSDIIKVMKKIIPDFLHHETGINLDDKM